MRNELELIEKIENYLLGKMNPNEKSEFEKEIQNNIDLKKKVEAQEKMVEAFKNIELRNKVKKGKFQYKLKKTGLKVLIASVIIGVGIAGGLLLTKTDKSSLNKTENDYQELLSELDGGSFENELTNQIYRIDNSKDTVVETEDGMVIYIPENAFNTDGSYDLLVKEAIEADDIILGGLQTFDENGNLLETGGMFRIEGIKDDKLLQLNKGKEFTVNVPTSDKKGGMKLYDGIRNTDGEITWTNPKPIENILQTVDILSLDFYPPNYEDSLDVWGKKQEKEYRDSLYYSFSGYCDADILSLLFFSVNDIPLKDSVKLPKENRTSNILFESKILFSGPSFSYMYTLSKEYELTIFVYSRPLEKFPFSISLKSIEGDDLKYQNIPNQKKDGVLIFKSNLSKKISVDLFFEAFDESGVQKSIFVTLDYNSKAMEILQDIDSSGESSCTILDPSKIKSIWNKKFNKTNLATREFEERISSIHQSCSSGILDLYVNNLSQELWVSDSIAYENSGNLKFKEFAKRKDGKVKINSKAQERLAAFFTNKSQQHQEKTTAIRNSYYQKQENLRQDFRAAKSSNEQDNIVQKYEQIEKETKYMLRDIPQFYQVKSPTGWKNIDQMVREKVISRESGTVTDGTNSVTLSFSPRSFKINNQEQYSRVKFYLLPQEISSYIKLKENSGSFDYKTNDDMVYDVVVIAYDESENIYSFYEKNTKYPASISLKKDNIKNIKKYLKNTEIKKEMDFVANDLKELKRKKEFRDDEAFRGKVEEVIFCGCTSYAFGSIPSEEEEDIIGDWKQ